MLAISILTTFLIANRCVSICNAIDNFRADHHSQNGNLSSNAGEKSMYRGGYNVYSSREDNTSSLALGTSLSLHSSGSQTSGDEPAIVTAKRSSSDPKNNNNWPHLRRPIIMSAEHRLYRHLLKTGDYRKTVRPKLEHTERLFVSLGICIMSVDEILEDQDPMVTSGCVKMKWTDEYLTWEPSQFGNLTSLVLPSSDIWLPDIALVNSAEPFITNRTSFVEVSYKGSVGFYPTGRFTTKCKISLTFFPFDRQVCEMQFESWTYPIEWIELTLWQSEPIDVKEFYRNHQWDIDRVDAVSGRAFYDGFEFSTMRFVFHVRRRTLHYITLYIFPCALISVMQILSHSLPVEHPARVTLLTGIFVAQSVIQSSLTSQTPKSSDGISLTQLYIEIFTACMLFSMIVTFMNMHVWFRVSNSPLLASCRFPTLGTLLKSFFLWDIKMSATKVPSEEEVAKPIQIKKPPHRRLTASLRRFCLDLRRQQQQQQREEEIVEEPGPLPSSPRPPMAALSRHRYSSAVPFKTTSLVPRVRHQSLAPTPSGQQQASATLTVQKAVWLRFCLTLDKICMYVFLIANVFSPIIIFAIVPHTYNRFLRTFDEDAHNSTNYFYSVDNIKVHYFHDFD